MVDIPEMFRAKQNEMTALLLGGRAVISHAGQKGAATEENWRSLLRSYLPGRYKIESGCVVDVEGNSSDQLDVLVLDNQYTPVLFESGGVRFYPAESIYATFEVKQEVDRQHIKYAGEKVASLRRLQRTSARIPHAGGEFSPKKPGRIIGGLLTSTSSWDPPLGDSFERALLSLDGQMELDIGCVLEYGSFSVDRSGRTPCVTKSKQDLSLVSFVFRLLAMLQSQGTVAAIDYEEWIRYTR